MKFPLQYAPIYCLLSLLLILICCATPSQKYETITHSIQGKATPWTHDRFDNSDDKFAFAIISDLYGGERPGIIEVALEQIEMLQPELVMSVGDLIDGGTEDVDQLKREWERFDKKVADIQAPFFHVGGNHDLTNVTMRKVWENRFGKRYYYFIYKDVLFLVLDSEDYQEKRMQEIYEARAIAIQILDGNEPAKAVTSEYYKMPERRTGEIGEEQSTFFKKVLSDHPEVKWTFLFMHKPVWMREDDGGLREIENAMSDRPYTVINGHFHTYNHTDKKNRDYITLGTTGGSQNDQSAMAFDHITWVTMSEKGPSIVNLKLEGVLDKYGRIPADGDKLCFQASKCIAEEGSKE